MTDCHLLAFETSADPCSVALLSRTDGQVRVRTAQHAGRRDHTEHILPLAQGLLVEAGLETRQLGAVAFGQGPGGFTGLRVGCGVAQGLALALDLPVLPVDSLCALAVQADPGDTAGVHVIVQDARMQEAYVAAYQAQPGGWLTLQGPALLALGDVPAWLERESAAWGMQAGSAWCVHGSALAASPGLLDAARALGARQTFESAEPLHAGTVARLAYADWQAGRGRDASEAAPVYVRNRVAYTLRERAEGLGGNPSAATGRTVHVMRPVDVDEVAAIERQVQSFPWSRQNFADSLAAGQTGWVVREMGAMLGFALLLEAPDFAHLLVLGVRPDQQRRGVGHLLVETCVAHCRAARLPALTLEVRASNAQAIAFYHQLGFRRTGLRRGYYPTAHGREDAWLMTLTLDGAA